jgi:hypothetical protein
MPLLMVRCSVPSTWTIGTSSVTSLQPIAATQPGLRSMPTTSRIPPLTVSVSVNSSIAFPILQLWASPAIQILSRVLSVISLTLAIPYPELRFLTSFLLVFPLLFPPFGQLSVGNTMTKNFFSRMQLPSFLNLNVGKV